MKFSNPQLKVAIASYVDANKISVETYEATRNNVAGLLDKIGKIFTLDTSYIDKLAFFDGDFLSMAKNLEEWQEDLLLPADYDPTGANTLSPHDPSYRPAFYSQTLGQKTFATTIRNNNLERAVHFIEQFNELVAMISKRLFDSEAMWRYAEKRQLIGLMIAECGDVYSTTKTFTASTKYDVGEHLRSASSGLSIKYGIVVKPIAVATALSSWAEAIAGGYVIEQDLITKIAKPVDTSSAEAFIKQLRNDVEIAGDYSEGHSLSGSTLGATENLVLLVKQGIMSSLDVDAMAGAFHLDKIGLPAEVVVIKDFGSSDTQTFAVLCDRRSVRLHDSYRAVREQMNAQGDFINYFLQTEVTAHYSKNTYLKVYQEPSE